MIYRALKNILRPQGSIRPSQLDRLSGSDISTQESRIGCRERQGYYKIIFHKPHPKYPLTILVWKCKLTQAKPEELLYGGEEIPLVNQKIVPNE